MPDTLRITTSQPVRLVDGGRTAVIKNGSVVKFISGGTAGVPGIAPEEVADLYDRKVEILGDVMLGPLILSTANPVEDLAAAPKVYVDTAIANSAGVIAGLYVSSADPRLADARFPSNDTDLVHRSGTELITGTKQFGSGVPDAIHGEARMFIMPQSQYESGIVMQAPFDGWGSGAAGGTPNYAQGQFLAFHQASVVGDDNNLDSILFRVDDKGSIGMGGGIHLATNLQGHFPTTQAMWINPYSDMIHVVSTGTPGQAAAFYQAVSSTGTLLTQITADGRVLGSPTGTAAAPSFSFAHVQNTGLYFESGLSLAAGGSRYMSLAFNYVIMDKPMTAPLGSVTAPAYSFAGDLNTGLFSPAADQVALAVGGLRYLILGGGYASFENVVGLAVPDGTVTNPGFTFNLDLNTGIYRSAADQLTITTGGVARVSVNNTNLVSAVTVLVPNGSATAPGTGFLNETNSGLYRSSAGITGLSVLGGAQTEWGSDGQTYLKNVTRNWLRWGTAGVAAPTLTTRSNGTKMVLYESLSGSALDFAIGIEAGAMWVSGNGIKFYGSTPSVQPMTLTCTTGRLDLSTVGSGAGLMLGGDALLYRSTADMLATPDSMEFVTVGTGPHIKSPDGTRYKIQVANGGALSAVAA